MAVLRKLPTHLCDARICLKHALYEVVDSNGKSRGKYCGVHAQELQNELNMEEQAQSEEK